MNQFSLEFTDPDLEKKYQSEAEHEKTSRFFTIVKMQLLLSLVSTIYYSIKTSMAQYSLMILCIILGLAILLLVLKKYLPKLLKYVLIGVFFAFTVLFTESIPKTRLPVLGFCFTEQSIALIVPLQLFIYAVLLTKTSWIFCIIYYILGCAYFFVRVFDLTIWSNKDLILFGFAFTIISFGFMSYKQEKTVREFYKSISDSNKNLKNFKLLLQNIMPDPIFIVNYTNYRLEFFNKSALYMLNSKNTGVNESLERISSDGFPTKMLKSQNLFKNFEKLMNSFTKSDNIKENDIDFNSLSISESLLKFFNSDDIQNFDQCNIFKMNKIKFHSINIMAEDIDYLQQVHQFEDNFVNIDKKHYFELKIVKISWENQPCLLILLNDNTNLRRIIELQNLDDYKNRLLATVSHDLRTPLNGLIGIFDVVIPQILEIELKKDLLIGQRSANLLLCMINDILDFSQIIHKKIRLNIDSVCINDVVQETAELIEFQAKKKNLQFNVNLKDIARTQKIYTDSNRIKQILLNLLSNSLKFTQMGLIKLKVQDCSYNFSRKIIKFSVKDTGIGIRENDKYKLFKLFGKLDQSDKELNKTGVGLGLTISQELAKLLNKNDEGIYLKSQFGKGSKFWFFVSSMENEEENIFSITENIKIKIPFTRSYSNCMIFQAEKKENSLYQKDIMHHKDKKVLIVDDDLINIIVAQKYMEFFGIKYLTASNGEEAFQLVQKDVISCVNEISLILMDCNMPILDGFQASRKIIQFIKENGLDEIPIIAVTANVELSDQKKCFEAGMKKFLAKPVRRKDLGGVLQNFFFEIAST